MYGAIPPLPHTCSWHGTWLSTGTTFPSARDFSLSEWLNISSYEWLHVTYAGSHGLYILEYISVHPEIFAPSE
jgi:hypothetical protein